MSLLLTAPALATVAPTALERASSPERAADKQDRMICKRFIETGSLVKGYRTCKTKREWDHERDNLRTARVTGGSCNPGDTSTCGK